MSTIAIIRVEIAVGGEGNEAHEYEHCPLGGSGGSGCRLRNIDCRYGLTEIHPPIGCPLRLGAKMNFTIVEVKP